MALLPKAPNKIRKIRNIIGGVIRRIRTKVYSRYFAPIKKTKPMKCNHKGEVEVHTQLCKKHLLMYISAMKSFLRFYDDVALIVHDDGSLTKKGTSLLKMHLPGIRIIEKKKADKEIATFLKDFPYCSEFRKKHTFGVQLFDFFFYSKAKKIISMDSDILFFRKPALIIDWINGDRDEIICFSEPRVDSAKNFFMKAGYATEPILNMCLCILCFYSNLLKLNLIEHIFSKKVDGGRLTAQYMFPILAYNSGYPLKALPSGEYQDRGNISCSEPVFRHYWASQEIIPVYCDDIRKVITEFLRKE